MTIYPITIKVYRKIIFKLKRVICDIYEDLENVSTSIEVILELLQNRTSILLLMSLQLLVTASICSKSGHRPSFLTCLTLYGKFCLFNLSTVHYYWHLLCWIGCFCVCMNRLFACFSIFLLHRKL